MARGIKHSVENKKGFGGKTYGIRNRTTDEANSTLMKSQDSELSYNTRRISVAVTREITADPVPELP